MIVKFFKARKDTHRFNKNQKVWIIFEDHNCLRIRFKWRGKGRYVVGMIDRFSKAVGEIKSIDLVKQNVNKLKLNKAVYCNNHGTR